jgi:predicted dehydrogenase
MKYNALVVGLGRIGLGFDLTSQAGQILTHTKAYLKHKDFNLVAGVDVNSSRRKEFQNYSGKIAYRDIEQFIEHDKTKIDVVSLCTPKNIRLSEFVKILVLKPRLVIIEKPLALTVDEAKKIKMLSAKHKIKIFVNYTRRVDPIFERLKKVLYSKKYGQISSIKINYYGGMYNIASHFIDLIMYYFGIPKNITCQKIAKREDGDIAASFILSFKGFDVSFNHVPSVLYSVIEMHLFLSKGKILISDGGVRIKAFKAVKDPIFKKYYSLKEMPFGAQPQPYKYQFNVLNHISLALKSNRPLASTVKTALNTLWVCKEIEHGI